MKERLDPVSAKKLFKLFTKLKNKKYRKKEVKKVLEDIRGEPYSESTVRNYFVTLNWICSRLDSVRNWYEFREELFEELDNEFGIKKALKTLRKKNLSLNHLNLREFLSIDVNITRGRAIISLLRGFRLVDFRKIPIITQRVPKDHIYEFIMHNGEVKYKYIRKKFQDSRRAVLSLWKERKVDIEDVEKIFPNPTTIRDFDNLEVEKPSSNFISISHDANTGEEIKSFTIPREKKVILRE